MNDTDVIETRAPGKLFIAGEYAVVEPGRSAVVVAVDRYVRVRATDAAHGSISSAHYAEPVAWRRSGAGIAVQGALDPATAAVEVVEALAVELGRPERPLALAIDSGLDDADGAKYGLGSSAAVVVATVRALAEAHGLGLDTSALLRLALLAAWRTNPSASGGDIAASTLGGWVGYRSGDAVAALAHRAESGVAATIAADWAGLAAEQLPAPAGLDLLVGWTGSPASTAALVARSRAAHRPDASFLSTSDATVAALAGALRAGDDAGVSTGIRSARAGLARYAALTGIEIETPALAALCGAAERRGAAAKSSGAGGGDCGIALAGPAVDRAALSDDWRNAGIRPLDLTIDPTGVTTTTGAPQGAATPGRTP